MRRGTTVEPRHKVPLRDILDMSEYTIMVFGTVVGAVSKGVRRTRLLRTLPRACAPLVLAGSAAAAISLHDAPGAPPRCEAPPAPTAGSPRTTSTTTAVDGPPKFLASADLAQKHAAVFDGRTLARVPEGLLRVVEEATTGGYDCLCVGEVHDDPVAHAVEHSLLQELAMRCREPGAERLFLLSLEMFERDTQPVMDEYLAGLARESDLLKDGRAWPNYADYRPLVEAARSGGMAVVCANASRRHVSLVGRRGLGALGELPRSSAALAPPLPVAGPSPAYASKFEFTMRSMSGKPEPGAAEGAEASDGKVAGGEAHADVQTAAAKAGSPGRAEGAAGTPPARECPYIGLSSGSSLMLEAQCLWDAAMAHSIAQALDAAAAGPPGRPPLAMHVCGKFHCEHGLGIPERLAGRRTLVVSCVPAAPVHMEAQELPAAARGMADFVVLTDATLPRSFDVQHPI
eukprot:jgi/Tetstr1/420271/TSEL_000140.t2